MNKTLAAFTLFTAIILSAFVAAQSDVRDITVSEPSEKALDVASEHAKAGRAISFLTDEQGKTHCEEDTLEVDGFESGVAVCAFVHPLSGLDILLVYVDVGGFPDSSQVVVLRDGEIFHEHYQDGSDIVFWRTLHKTGVHEVLVSVKDSDLTDSTSFKFTVE